MHANITYIKILIHQMKSELGQLVVQIILQTGTITISRHIVYQTIKIFIGMLLKQQHTFPTTEWKVSHKII